MNSFHLVETKALRHVTEANFRQQFNQYEEFVFRYELSVLLTEGKALYREGDFVMQNVVYICEQIQKRLQTNHAWDMDSSTIKRYLKNVSKVIRSKLANGEDVSALPFTGKSYKKRGRKVQPKRGKKRKVVITLDGKSNEYESIAEADRQTGLGYDYIQRHSLQAWREENAI